MEEDPERSVRRLVDLGKQFSKNRFQDTVFSVMQESLNNENSAYYDMLHNLLKNTDHENMKKFGINFGYMSWAYGAANLRKQEESTGVCIPWCLKLRFDPSNTDGLNQERIASLIEQSTRLGIYAFFIRECGNSTDSYELLELLERYSDCSFVWVKGNGRLTAAQIQMLKVCKNTLVSLPVEEAESLLTAALLRDQKILFSMHLLYDDDETATSFPLIMESVLASEISLFFLIQKDGTVRSAREWAYKSRMAQEYPCCVIDYYGDGISVSNIIAQHDTELEIGSDGTILRPLERQGDAFDFDLPLIDALKKVMPNYISSK